MNNYNVDSRSYLERAKLCLNGGTIEAVFYGALELRCGIEARAQEYLEAWDHISKRKKQGWQIAKLGQSLESAFRSGNTFIEVGVFDRDNMACITTVYYTPITSELKDMGKKLGQYLHAQQEFLSIESEGYLRLHDLVTSTLWDLQLATAGTLLGPPLRNTTSNTYEMKLEGLPPLMAKYLEGRLKLGESIIMDVKHLDKNEFSKKLNLNS